MKTAISLPDPLFAEAKSIAHELGIPRSQLFAKALEEFVDRHRALLVTERLNGVYSGGTTAQDESPASVESLRRLTHDDAW